MTPAVQQPVPAGPPQGAVVDGQNEHPWQTGPISNISQCYAALALNPRRGEEVTVGVRPHTFVIDGRFELGSRTGY